jgi:hypothetical protein
MLGDHASFNEADLTRLGECDECHQKVPVAFLKKLASYQDGVRTLCERHFAEHVERLTALEGKPKTCKVCGVPWPKTEIVDATCPVCRENNYTLKGPPSAGKFRCTRCLKTFYLRDRSPALDGDKPVCYRCAYAIAQASPASPFLTPHAIDFLRSNFERGFLLCEKCHRLKPLEEFPPGASFRDRQTCYACRAKKR